MIITVLLLVLAITAAESAQTQKWESIGCYEAQDWELFLKHSVTVHGNNTLDACALACHGRHYDTFGLRDGVQCRCDDELRNAEKKSDDRCESQCVNDPTRKCGTGDFVHLFQFQPNAEFKWAAWSAWDACSVTCGSNGNQKRTRECLKFTENEDEPTKAPRSCGNLNSEDQNCSATKPCDEFKWAAWSAWSACSVTCGPNGNQKRTRECTKITGTDTEPTNSTLCPGNIDSEDQSCNATNPCSELKWSDWSAWSVCSTTCGPNGQQKRTRQCQRVAGSQIKAENSSQCPGNNDTGFQSCNATKPCPVFKCKAVASRSKTQTPQCYKITGRNKVAANATKCAGRPVVKDKSCSGTKACCKTKGNSGCTGLNRKPKVRRGFCPAPGVRKQ